MPTLLGRYRPEIPPGMGPQFDSDDQDDYASTQSNFNGNQLAADAAIARRQMDPLNSLPPEPPRQSATAPASLQPPTPPPQRATPPPPSASANAPEPPPEIQPAAPSQWAPPSDKPVGPGNFPNETGTADKLMDDFAKEGTSRPEAPKDNIWQRIARVATTVLGADPDRQEAMLHPKYAQELNRYDRGVQDDAIDQQLENEDNVAKSKVKYYDEMGKARGDTAKARLQTEKDNAAAKQERAQQARATWQLAMSDKGALRQDPNKIPPPGYTLIDDPIEPGVKWAAPPAPKNQMMKLTPELAKAMNKQPGEEVPEASYLAFAQIEAKKTNEDAVLADRNYQKEQDRQAKQENLRLAASLKEPRPVPDSSIRRGETRKIKNIAGRILSNTIDQGGTAMDAIKNAQKFYRDDPEVNDYRTDVVEELQRMAISQGRVDNPPGSRGKTSPFTIQNGKIVMGGGAAPASKPNGPPQQAQAKPQAQQQPKAPAQAPVAASKKPFPRAHLAGFAAQNNMPPQQAEQLLAQQGYVLQ